MVQAPVDVEISSVGRNLELVEHDLCVLCNYVHSGTKLHVIT